MAFGKTFTGKITTLFTVPDGMTKIDMVNRGNTDGKFKGSVTTLNGIQSDFVTLAKGESFSFNEHPEGYNGIQIDGTGTIIEVVIQ